MVLFEQNNICQKLIFVNFIVYKSVNETSADRLICIADKLKEKLRY
jgi:hypothetical protein